MPTLPDDRDAAVRLRAFDFLTLTRPLYEYPTPRVYARATRAEA